MSNDNVFETLWKQQATIGKLVLDGKRDPRDVSRVLQDIISPPAISATPTKQAEKFGLLVDLGIITVPEDYDHATRLSTFGKHDRKKFRFYDDDITDEHFPNPTRILKPGDKLRVRVFKQIVSRPTTSEERMAFLATQKAVHVGVQGASLVWEQRHNKLPKGYWYASMDEKDRLWKDADGRHRVIYVDARSNGGFDFDLGRFEIVWDNSIAILCFYDIE